MTSYTRSGARRTGDEYQDLQSAEVLVEWLGQPNAYRWVRLETMKGSLDDIQAERADGNLRMLQIKFGTDATIEWEWDDLTKQESGVRGPKLSLLQKWQASLNRVVASGVTVSEAALLTNCAASAAIRAHLSDSGLLDFGGLSAPLRVTISEQLGGSESASTFFASFHFHFKERSIDALEVTLQQRFWRLGGTTEGWSSLMGNIRRWINRKDQPSPDGTITLADVRAAALWHLPQPIPQGFLVPDDYVAPQAWSAGVVEPLLRAGGDSPVVVTGSPGAGKSTYLSWLLESLQKADVPVVRHHYFLSLADSTPNRTAWETAADAIIGQLRSSYEELVRAADCRNPLPGRLPEFLVAAGRERADMHPLVVIVDGLDHVWRDTDSEEGLRRLFDLLLPVPKGVVVVVGTQNIDVNRIPRKLRDLCPRNRWLEVPALDGEGVHEWLKCHEHELGLPEDRDHASRVLGELGDVFRDVSGGHPLVLHYTLEAARWRGPSIRPDEVRALPSFAPNSSVAIYYQALWETISPEGHLLLHLLSGFQWAWPRDGLLQCLAPMEDPVRLEQAERAIRQVLGTSPAGVTAFHESLLAFVRALPDHKMAAQSLRPRVVDWLTHHAPEYWRWRHEWQERARNGDAEPLVSSATLDWCVDSLAAGRGRTAIAEVVAASGWAALEAGRLGVATERHYIDAYLEEAGHAEGVLSRLVWLGLRGRNQASRNLELNLFLSRKAQASYEEIEAAAEVAFSAGQRRICQDLLHECGERWDAAVRCSDRMGDTFSSLERVLPSLIAASLMDPPKGPYQRHASKHNAEPEWCSRRLYAKALARHCALGGDTEAIRAELRFLANHEEFVSFEAVDEIVRLAWRDGFDPDQSIQNCEARRSGLFRCDRIWVRRAPELPSDAPQEVSFLPVSQDRFGRDRGAFVDLARSYFFSCLAGAAEGRKPEDAVGLNVRASEAARFLSLLRDLAVEAADSKKAGRAVGGAWFAAQLATVDPPEVMPNDVDNHLVLRGPVAQVVVAIAQDLEGLHYAETGVSTLTRDAVMVATHGAWAWERVWIEDRVGRRLTMHDSPAARLLIDCERARLEETKDYLQTRAEEYASLAQFCLLQSGPADEVRELARLAARNLLGHGYHKDLVLFDVLSAIRVVPGASKARTLARLQSLSPVIQVVDEITDGDETDHLKSELGKVIGDLAPEVLPPYVRALQRDHHHWAVESFFTDLVKSAPLGGTYDRAFAATLVHEGTLTALQRRADSGDLEAASVLANTLTYLGRSSVAPEKLDSGSPIPGRGGDKSPPAVENYPPERLTEFVRAVRDAHIYEDDHLATWTTYWASKDPKGLFEALTAYRVAHGYPLEKQTANAVVELALEWSGREAAWEWLAAYHEAVYGWSFFAYSLADVEGIWEFVRSRFRDRWLEFITATSHTRWQAAGRAPGWSIGRMVRFLGVIGEADRAAEVLDAAVAWGAALAANIRLPDPALTADQPERPVALRLLVDRLDCPSRMVQERAAWSLAGLLASPDTCDATTGALLDWHAAEPLELRSCALLLVLHLARTAHAVSAGACVGVARQAILVPSIGADLLLREFGDDGTSLAASLDYRRRHSGLRPENASIVEDFDLTVGAHLAPIFSEWASMLDSRGPSFTRLWEWEAVRLANQQGLSLRSDAHVGQHYRGGVGGPVLEINDRLSVVLRSAYLRALHSSVETTSLEVDRAEVHARRVGVMADPVLWAVRPSKRPEWWPEDPGEQNVVETLSEAVGQAVRGRFENREALESEILLFAAGPVGSRPRFRAEIVIRAVLQAAHGPLKPTHDELVAEIPSIGCGPTPRRLSLPGTYTTLEGRKIARRVRDWLVAPLAWGILPDTEDWLLPERQCRGLHMPATWIVPGALVIDTTPSEVCVTFDEQPVARYRYWNDELRERHYVDACSRVGGELLLRTEWLEPHLTAGATLCWVVTLSVAQRGEYKGRFGKPQVIGTWVFGGSHIVRPEPWTPPTPS